MKKDWENVTLMPEFDEQGVACYRLDGGVLCGFGGGDEKASEHTGDCRV